MKVTLQPKTKKRMTFLFEGEESAFGPRIEKYLDSLTLEIPWLDEYSLLVESENTFPHSAGIASSASAFGALGLCLADLNRMQTGIHQEGQVFLQAASRLARLGSGSASRSVYPVFAWWGKSAAVSGSTDCYALPVTEGVHPSYLRLCDAVLLVDSGKKRMSSSAGHELMSSHPYKEGRIKQANMNAEELIAVMKTPDFSRFFDIVENEALSLHALMMSSCPSFVLLKPASLFIVDKIRQFREMNRLPVGFTIDAGPNIHLLYFEEHKKTVHQFINNELVDLLEGGNWLDDRIGEGPEKLI